MRSKTKISHSSFVEYMNFIIKHRCYNGLAITKKEDGSYTWVAPAKSEIGRRRKEWCENKAFELGLIMQPNSFYSGMYADTMLKIHPTKQKVCQICGKEMSLFYHYPSKKFLKSINKTFGICYTHCDHISDIWDNLLGHGVKEENLKIFFNEKCKLALNPTTTSKEEIIDKLEFICRKGNGKFLGPGAMSNFPDRFDGFHSYNRCCRGKEDKGRSKENLKTYSKDRRAYKYWSDGNIQAANQFMSSSHFQNVSADHIGPISLGFVHDSHYLQQMSINENSSKRDRLSIEDIESMIKIQDQTNICPISWYSSKIWGHIRTNYKSASQEIISSYRKILKQNIRNFMHILYTILTSCPDDGKNFLLKAYIEPKLESLQYDYQFYETGEIKSRSPRHLTNQSKQEFDRHKRIAIESIYNYNTKDNRKNYHDLQKNEIDILNNICNLIKEKKEKEAIQKAKKLLEELLERIQTRLIQNC